MQKMKISIITPSYMSGASIEKAIQSVLIQDYTDYEHLIVDGGSTDNTLDILKSYNHLRWISEPDKGQVDAMTKGFAMATGDIIGYLNADDYYLKCTFSNIVSHLNIREKVVMGKVLVRSEKTGGVDEWVCDPKTDFPSVLRHWGANAFCVNPVGYFYLREVQENIPLMEDAGAKHDLAFLMEVSLKYSIKKIDAILGVFNHAQDTQTGREQLVPSYWQPDNFSFVDKLLDHLSDTEQKKYRLDRERGYQLRRLWTVKEAFSKGMAQQLFEQGEVFMLPEDELECKANRCGFVEHDRIGTIGDWVVPVLTMGKVASMSICHTLKSIPDSIFSGQIYHIHQINPATISYDLPICLPESSYQPVGLSLSAIYNQYKEKCIFKCIAGVRDPVACGISGSFHNSNMKPENLESEVIRVVDYILSHFDFQYRDFLGIDIYKYPFDFNKRYTIIKEKNIEILIFRFEDLAQIFSQMMEDFLGIPNLKIARKNITSDREYSEDYNKAKHSVRFDGKQLEKIYDSKFVKHFYSEKEISCFFQKWVQPVDFSSGMSFFWGTIYDVGMHIGQDTEFYLKKGFKVIAIDANPAMCSEGREKFSSYIASGQLEILNVGIVEKPTNEKITFFVNEKVSEWSSFNKSIAVRDNSPYREINVSCVTLNEIVEKYGNPYYVKIDIEGNDLIALKSLLSIKASLPKYVSVENGNGGMMKMLANKGYDRFKYVQQKDIQAIQLPNPAKESFFVEHTFPYGASGPFGEETVGDWKDYSDILFDIAKVWDPEGFAKNPDHDDAIHGWFDLHAKLSTK